ncbi:uncharacterized protein LOC128547329 [Mercenaria mercenaria]|uniref:uncharacterized protein LOC128547329 n=1 Tax=Mercenaria mercenaria TaxID=6596 RepID=UPI00234ECA82|nr:uncharacterized protein LOC128547329 [Mercenaria mercenaria]
MWADVQRVISQHSSIVELKTEVTCSGKQVAIQSLFKMVHFYILYILILTKVSVPIYSSTVAKPSNNCIVSLSIPQENIKTVCDGGDSYHIDQKLRSTDIQISSLRHKINNMNVRLAYTLTQDGKCNCATYIPERLLTVEQNVANLQAKFTKLGQYDETNPTNKGLRNKKNVRWVSDDSVIEREEITKKKFARIIRNIIRKELKIIKQEKQRNVLHNHEYFGQESRIKQNLDKLLGVMRVADLELDRKSALSKHNIKHMQADDSFVENRPGIFSFVKAMPENEKSEHYTPEDKLNDSGFNDNDKGHMTRRMEEMEHDIETLANGIAALHENMFDSKDIRIQFEDEKISMENRILEKCSKEYHSLKLEIEYMTNQTQIVYKLLQATVKSQKQLQASIQNFNATFKLKNYDIERNISRISSQLDTLYGTLDLYPSYSDTNVDDTIKMLEMEETVAFVGEIKNIWPTLVSNLTTIAIRQEDIMKVVDNSSRKYETEIETMNKYEQSQNSTARNNLRSYRLILVIINIFQYFVLYKI